VSYAGHPPAWLFRASDERWSRLRPAANDGRLVDLPLAVETGTTFSRRQERVQPGDRVLIVTDGVLEAPGPGGELFGEQRLEALLAEQARADVGGLVHALLDALVRYTGDAQLAHDDVTMLLLEFKKGPRAYGIWHALKSRLLGPPKGNGAARPEGERGRDR
jgi:sigma-B regulation protein RsbU (phosphoserine phosphatase)